MPELYILPYLEENPRSKEGCCYCFCGCLTLYSFFLFLRLKELRAFKIVKMVKVQKAEGMLIEVTREN